MSVFDPTTTIPCPTEGCPGRLLVGAATDPVTVYVQDDVGMPILDTDTGEILRITLQLPRHALDVFPSTFRPGGPYCTICDQTFAGHPDLEEAGHYPTLWRTDAPKFIAVKRLSEVADAASV